MAQVDLDGHAVSLLPGRHNATHWADRLRRADPPVIVRISEDRVWIDPRTLLPGDDDDLVSVLTAILR